MVTQMLELAIETEGLIRIIREGNPFPENYALLRKKSALLAELAAALEDKTFPHIAPEVPIKEETAIEEEDAINEDEEKEDVENTQPITEHKEILMTETPEETPEDSTDVEESETVVGVSEGEEEDDIFLSIEDDPEPDPISIEEPDNNAPKQSAPETPAPSAQKRVQNLKSKFSLNDRFLYSRELFDGNMKMFDSTLAFIEGVESFSILEDYFYSELDWDPDNRFVASFMEILKRNY